MFTPPLRSVCAILCGLLAVSVARGQDQRGHFPLDHRAPTGKAAHWNVLARPALHSYPQPVRITVPGTARVTFYEGSAPEGLSLDAPAQARLLVGYAYRVQISNLSDFPGVELFPTIEVLDRLHPPPSLVDDFPIPIDLTAEEIAAALADRMVTKVIYLERQDLPRPPHRRDRVTVTDLAPGANLLHSATQMGRPVAILRLGGRTLDPEERAALSAPPVPLQMTLSNGPGQ